MGIPRLTGFIEKHFTGWQRKELRGRLVIDGYNIRHHLNKCDWSHGGQFREYREHIFSFYGDLKGGGVVPIVVLDGIDYTGKKWPTVLKRGADRIRQVHKEVSRPDRKADVRSQSVFPALGSEVYVQALIDLGIEYVVVDGEADDALVEIANYYKCPVLSSDSDFFIYNVEGGLVRMERMNIQRNLITAEVYYYQVFCEQFRFWDESVRFIIPALVGNDFWTTNIENEHFQLLLEEEELGPLYYDDHALLPYVQFASLFDSMESFVDEIAHFPYLGSGRRSKLRENCQQSTQIYDSRRVIKISDMLEVTVLCTSEGDPIPLWALRNYRKGHLSKHSASALVMKRYALHLFVDDTTKESCVVTSLPIRKYIYGILGCDLVTEHFRVEQQLSGEKIHSFKSLSGHPLPSLCDMPRLGESERESLLYLILGCNKGAFQALDGHWKLVLAATVFWYKATQPPLHLVKSLLLCFLICSGHSAELRRRFTATTEFRHGPEWMRNLHSFAQWQSCYKDAVSLDKVLMLPLPVTCPSLLYDGRLVMYFAMPQNFDRLIHYLHADVRLFWKLLGVVVPDVAQQRTRYRHPLASPHEQSYEYQRDAGQQSDWRKSAQQDGDWRSAQQGGDWRKSAQQDGDWQSAWQGGKVPAQQGVGSMHWPGEWKPSPQQGGDWRKSAQQDDDWRSTWQGGKVPAQQGVDQRRSLQWPGEWKPSPQQGGESSRQDGDWRSSSRQGGEWGLSARDWRQAGNWKSTQQASDRKPISDRKSVPQQEVDDNVSESSRQQGGHLRPVEHAGNWGSMQQDDDVTQQDYDVAQQDGSQQTEKKSLQVGHSPFQQGARKPTSNHGGRTRNPKQSASSQSGKPGSQGHVKRAHASRQGREDNPTTDQQQGGKGKSSECRVTSNGSTSVTASQCKVGEDKPASSQVKPPSEQKGNPPSGRSQHKSIPKHGGRSNPSSSQGKPSSLVEHKPVSDQGTKTKPPFQQKLSGIEHKPPPGQKQRGNSKPSSVECKPPVSGRSQSEHKPASCQSSKCNHHPSSKQSKPTSSSGKPASVQGGKNKPPSSQKQGGQKPLQGRGATASQGEKGRDKPTTPAEKSVYGGVTESKNQQSHCKKVASAPLS